METEHRSPSPKILVKICGLTRSEDAEAAVAAGVDFLGFVFRQGTPRALEPSSAGWVREMQGAEKVGVFLDAPLDEVVRVRDLLGLDWVQLHGNEPDSFLEVLGPRVIRRVPVAEKVDWDRVAFLSSRCLPLFDPGAGDGIAFDWSRLPPRPTGLWVGLAGGLTSASVGDAVRLVRPDLVDVSTGVESAPGIKDPNLVATFVSAARTAVESAALESS